MITWQTENVETITLKDFGSVELNSSKTFTPLADTTYEFNVEGPGGSLTETITVTVSPVITAQPTDIMVDEGSSAEISLTAMGPDLVYQWQKNGTDISGAVAPLYRIENSDFADNGSIFKWPDYRVEYKKSFNDLSRQ